MILEGEAGGRALRALSIYSVEDMESFKAFEEGNWRILVLSCRGFSGSGEWGWGKPLGGQCLNTGGRGPCPQ